jgi:transposase-like protein
MLVMTLPHSRAGRRLLPPADRDRRDTEALGLIRAGWTVAAAARQVGITERHLYRRLAQLRAATQPQPQDPS